MHISDIFKHKHHQDDKEVDKKPKEEHQKEQLPKGFANDAMRSSNKPDTLYGFDDPMARRLGPVPSEDPTNTGA